MSEKDPKKVEDPRPEGGDPKKPNPRAGIFYLVVLVVLVVLAAIQYQNVDITSITGETEATETVELANSEFVAAVEDGRVVSVTYHASTAKLEGTYYAKKGDSEAVNFTATYVDDEGLQALMNEHPEIEFDVDVQTTSWWYSLLTSLLPMLLLLAVFIFFMSRIGDANNQQMQFGKTKAKKAAEEQPKTRFKDVAGIDEVVEELDEIKEFLSNPAKFQALGAKIPRGVLLVGPPGTGKTLLARAVAGEAGVPFFSISGSDFVEMFVGVGASRVRDLFAQAKEASPSIIFIDEIDAVGRQRGAGVGGGHDEREQTLNQMLVEMDGFDENESVVLIAATNRADILDPALLRPGRFDRQIIVTTPDKKGREEILKVHADGKPMDESVNLKSLAGITSGFSGADLANLLNEAALLAARRNKKAISQDEVSEAMERQIAGPQRKGRLMTEREKSIIAYHESGHALVGHLLEHADPVHKITIIARGQALGYTLSIPEEDRFLQSKKQMQDDLAMFLGGRVAEEIVFGDVTTGASNDLERATKMAKDMVTRYGMSELLGHQVYGQANREVFLGRDYGATADYGDDTAKLIDAEVGRIMTEAYEEARRILTENREQLELMAAVLIDREQVEGEACQMLLDNKWDEWLVVEAEREAAEAARAEAAKAEEMAAKAAELQAKLEKPEPAPAPVNPDAPVKPE